MSDGPTNADLLARLEALQDQLDPQRWVTLEEALRRVPMNRETARQLIKTRCRTLSRGRRVLVWLPSLSQLADPPQRAPRTRRTKKAAGGTVLSWEDT